MENQLIYIVDDDKDERFFIAEGFAQFLDVNRQTRFFTSGFDLLKALNDKDIPRPNFILMDINMPAINGIEVLKDLKQNPDLKNIPVIMFSTSNAHEDKANCINNGAAKFITKPNTMIEYPSLLRGLVESQMKAVNP
jgi:CheY-like chemotaxis protein